MSNVILEETRMLNDTKAQTEQLEVIPDDMPDEIQSDLKSIHLNFN